MSRPAYIKIDLAALQHNFAQVRKLAPNRAVIAMVKANAYGHGLTQIAQALPMADAFGVASLEEGMALRAAGITKPIVLMEGLFGQEEITEAAHHQFTLVVHQAQHVQMLEQATVSRPFKVWLKINTGMNRLGIDPEQFPPIYQRLLAAKSVHKPIGLMTHFAEADAISSNATAQQIQLFDHVIAGCEGPRSLANSAAVLAWPAAHGDWVRPGLMLYGASPFAQLSGPDHQLRPVMTFWSRLIAITHVKKHGKIGYGGTFTAPEEMRIGIVGAGYGDGYPQYASSGTPVLVNGAVCPLVGRVSMDMLTVDLRAQPEAKVGDPVVLWGASLPAEKIAQCSHTSVYELFTRMTSRPKITVSA